MIFMHDEISHKFNDARYSIDSRSRQDDYVERDERNNTQLMMVFLIALRP